MFYNEKYAQASNSKSGDQRSRNLRGLSFRSVLPDFAFLLLILAQTAMAASVAAAEDLKVVPSALEAERHYDPSYKIATKIMADIRKSTALGAGDYYSYLRFVPQIESKALVENDENCERGKMGWSYTTKVQISYVGKSAMPTRTLTGADGSILLTANSNFNPADKAFDGSCTVLVAEPSSSPYILQDGFSSTEGYYNITLHTTHIKRVEAGSAEKYVGYFIAIATALKPNIFGSGNSDGVKAASRMLDDIRASGDSIPGFDDKWKLKTIDGPATTTEMWRQKTANRLEVQPTGAISRDGNNLIFYSRRSGSIILDNLLGSALNPKNTNYQKIKSIDALSAKKNCVGSDDKCPNISAEGWAFTHSFDRTKAVLSPNNATDKAAIAAQIEFWSKLGRDCKTLKEKLIDWHLATIDRLLLRWALLAQAGYFDTSGKFLGHVSDGYRLSALATEYSAIDTCWSQKDSEFLSTVERHAKIRFSSVID